MSNRSAVRQTGESDKSCPQALFGCSGTKNEILKASRKLFAARGFEAVSMRDIAGVVGVRASALYNHFPGKHHILANLMTLHMQRVLVEMSTVLDGLTDPLERLTQFTRYHVLLHIDHTEDVFLAYYEIRSLKDPHRREIISLRDEYEAMLRQILVDGKTSGVFQLGDAAVHARAQLAMLTGITQWYRSDGSLGREEILETYMGAVLNGVGRASHDF